MNRQCFFCNSESLSESKNHRQTKFLENLYSYFKCKLCRGYSLFPKLTNKQLEFLYSDSYSMQSSLESCIDSEYVEKFEMLAKELDQKDPLKYPRFLDYGCGHNPATLSIASNLGYQVHGVEFSQDVVDRARLVGSGPIVTVQEFQTTEDEFDIIFLGDVLEHLIDPIDDLIRLKSRLSDQGILIAQGPLQGARTIFHSMIELNARLRGSIPTDYPPYHVSLAHKASMEKLFINAGYKLVKLLVKEVQWPAPTLRDFLLKPTFRGLFQILAKIVDRFIAMVVPSYGSHYFAVLSH